MVRYPLLHRGHPLLAQGVLNRYQIFRVVVEREEGQRYAVFSGQVPQPGPEEEQSKLIRVGVPFLRTRVDLLKQNILQIRTGLQYRCLLSNAP